MRMRTKQQSFTFAAAAAAAAVSIVALRSSCSMMIVAGQSTTTMQRKMMEDALASQQQQQVLYKRITQKNDHPPQQQQQRHRHLKHKKKKKRQEEEEEEETRAVDDEDASASPSSSFPSMAVPSLAVPLPSPMSMEEFDTDPLPTFFPTTTPTADGNFTGSPSPSPDVANTMRTLTDAPTATDTPTYYEALEVDDDEVDTNRISVLDQDEDDDEDKDQDEDEILDEDEGENESNTTMLDEYYNTTFTNSSSFMNSTTLNSTTLEEYDDEDENEDKLFTATVKLYITTLSNTERQAMERTVELMNENHSQKRNSSQIAMDGGYGDDLLLASDILEDESLLDVIVDTVIDVLEDHVVHGDVKFFEEEEKRKLAKKESLKHLRLTYMGANSDAFSITNSGLYWIELILPFEVYSKDDEEFVSDHKLLELQEEITKTMSKEVEDGHLLDKLQREDSCIQDVYTIEHQEAAVTPTETIMAEEKVIVESDDEQTTKPKKGKNEEGLGMTGAATVNTASATDSRSPFPPMRIAGCLLLIATISVGAALPVLAKRHRLAKESEEHERPQKMKKMFSLATHESVNDFLEKAQTPIGTKVPLRSFSGRNVGGRGIMRMKSNRSDGDQDDISVSVGEYDHVTRKHQLEIVGVGAATSASTGIAKLNAGSWEHDDDASEASFTNGGGACMISEFRTAYSEEYDDVPESLMDIHDTSEDMNTSVYMDYYVSGSPPAPPSLREQFQRDQNDPGSRAGGGQDLVRVLSFP